MNRNNRYSTDTGGHSGEHSLSQKTVINSRWSAQCYLTDKPSGPWESLELQVPMFSEKVWKSFITSEPSSDYTALQWSAYFHKFITAHWCNYISPNLVFGQLYFTSLQINADWLAALQLFRCTREPRVQLVQSVLELTQTQQSTLQLMLKIKHADRKISGYRALWDMSKLSFIHYLYCLSFEGRKGLVGADPSWHLVRVRVHVGDVATDHKANIQGKLFTLTPLVNLDSN